MRRYVCLLLFFSAVVFNRSYCQSAKTLKDLEDQCQACLDKGQHMLRCSQSYYTRVDSLLNVVYGRLKQQLAPPAFHELKAEQLQWLQQRDVYFKRIVLSPEEQELRGADREMVIVDRKAQFVRDRVAALIKRL